MTSKAGRNSRTEPTPEEVEKENTRRTNFQRELIGMFLGLGLSLMVGAMVPAINQNYSLGVVVLWGGALGGILASWHRFEQAGAALTKSSNRPLNLAVGFGIPLIILLFVFTAGR